LNADCRTAHRWGVGLDQTALTLNVQACPTSHRQSSTALCRRTAGRRVSPSPSSPACNAVPATPSQKRLDLRKLHRLWCAGARLDGGPRPAHHLLHALQSDAVPADARGWPPAVLQPRRGVGDARWLQGRQRPARRRRGHRRAAGRRKGVLGRNGRDGVLPRRLQRLGAAEGALRAGSRWVRWCFEAG
jgi:hypothetical protein